MSTIKKDKYKVGKVNIILENFFKGEWDNSRIDALYNLLYFPLRLLRSMEGHEIDPKSGEKLYQFFEASIDHRLYTVLSNSWKELFGEESFLPYHLDGCILDGDPESYDVNVFKHILDKNNVGSILDIGCGGGHNINFFKGKVKNCLGVDGSPRAINYAKIKHPDIKFLEHDFCKPDIPTIENFDVVFSIEFLEHIEERFQKNYMRIFEKAKKCYVTFAPEGQPGYHHVNCKNQEYWIEVFRKSGFEFCKEETAVLRSIAGGYYFKTNGLVFERRVQS